MERIKPRLVTQRQLQNVSRRQNRSNTTGRLPVMSFASHQEEPHLSLSRLLQEFHPHTRRSSVLSMARVNSASAFEALMANPLRSLLTILGIFIGIASVIAALSITQGTGLYIQHRLAVLGDSVIVEAGAAQNSGAYLGTGSLDTLTVADAEAMRQLPHVRAETPFLDIPSQVVYGRQNWNTIIEGVNSQALSIQNWTLAQGNWFSDIDVQQGSSVAVLGDTVYHSLFDASGDSPLNKEIRIGTQIFRVIGVLAPQGGSFSQDNLIFVPLRAVQLRLDNTPYINDVEVQVDNPASVNQVVEEITALLRQRHHILGGQLDDFQVITFTAALQDNGQTNRILTYLLVGLAAISLSVGGIGIMNIMLVSVTQRAWEIGVRMAVGARRADIRNQFLIEALMLCLFGGAIGLILGLGTGWLLTSLANVPFVVTAMFLVVPFVVSVGVALIFGLYPAIYASRLDPATALRAEE